MDDSLHSIPAAIDRLLLEHGVYAPVELLLVMGRLRYADYEAWRCGDIATLELALGNELVGLGEFLEEAAAYVRALGLESEEVQYKGWRGRVAELSLRSFYNDDLETAWCTHYRSRPDTRQMDLFIDNVEAALAKGIAGSLVARRGEEVDRLIARLYSHNPQSPQLDAFVSLRTAQKRFSASRFDVCDALREMQHSIVPLATRALQSARDYLIPLWRSMADALRDWPFDPQCPELHCSYVALEGMDWVNAIESVEREPDWRCHGVLHLRRAMALDEEHQRSAARDAWFELCWSFPEQAETTFRAGRYPLERWGQSWQVFEDLDPQLSVSDYPAWQLLVRPDVARTVREPEAANFRALRGFSVVRQLVTHRQSLATLPDERELALRAELKGTNEALFAHFMRLHVVLR